MNSDKVELINYIQPILSSCSGFIKTDGYMTHFPGTVVIMDADEMYCGIIKIPVIYDVFLTAKINTLLSIKTNPETVTRTGYCPDLNVILNISISPASVDEQIKALYFTGWNIKAQNLIRYYDLYSDIDSKVKCIYHEPNCNDIDNFSDVNSHTEIRHVNIIDGSSYYRIPVSKAITTGTKSDTIGLYIYDYIVDPLNPQIKTSRYSIYKKKFKVTVDLFSNILLV